jgi:3-hydroxyacyl-[acyl-carrier-protein] dehydratase
VLTDLYDIKKMGFADGKLSASVLLNEMHEIFAGHFPGQPVLPGVCQMALVKDILERHFSKKLATQKAEQVKFLAMIDPRRTPDLDIQIQISESEGILTAQSVISSGEIIFLKSKCRFADA